MKIPSFLSRMSSFRLTVLLVFFIVSTLQRETDGAQIKKVSFDRKGQVLVELDDGKKGRLCFGKKDKVAQAVCTVYWGKYQDASMKALGGDDALNDVVAALNGCDGFKPDNIGAWNLNNDCIVVTGGSIPQDTCKPQREGINCAHLAELVNGRNAFEGLVMITDVSGSNATVCADNVGYQEAAAVCRSTGYPTKHAMALINRYQPIGNFTSRELQSCSDGDTLFSCKWKTVTSDRCKSASNQLSVSCAADPPTPKPWPNPTLNCFRQKANICFANISLTDQSDVDIGEASNITECRKSFRYIHVNSTGQVCIEIKDYLNCAKNFTDTPNHIEYKLIVNFFGEKDDKGNFIRPPLNFVMFCEINKESVATGATIMPQFSTPAPLRNNSVNGISVVELYEELIDGELRKPLLSSVRVGMNIYAAVVLKQASVNSLLVVNDCLVTDGTTDVHLILNKCPNSTNVNLIRLNQTILVVQFRAFLLSGSSGSSSLSVQCKTIVCHKDDPSDECRPGCNTAFQNVIRMANSRREVQRPEYQVTPPAYLTVLPEDDGKSSGSLSKTQLLLWPMAVWLLGLKLFAV